MVYPIFEINSIIDRYTSDIKQFRSIYQVNEEIVLLLDNNFTRDSMKTAIETILNHMQELGLVNDENYVDSISYKDKTTQNALWICRTQLFYQLLIFVTATFNDKALYDEIYSDTEIYPYREDIRDALKNFKIGIFGSITPTSDIDIGIQYSGNSLETPGLAYIVSRFESLFLIFTGKSSLDFDIETYADMMTIPNPNSDDSKNPDFFYLDASKFSDTEFARMLKCAGNSIIRNLYLPHTGKDITLSPMTFEKELELLKFNVFFLPQITEQVRKSLEDKKWIDDANKEILEFLNADYETQRKKYYEKVEIAETLKFEKLRHDIEGLTPSVICDIMVAIGDSLTYRMESYTCAPTIIHVVRILQASKNDLEKYKTLVPKIYCVGEIVNLDPFCTIGYYGYILSMLEQFGYLSRFYVTYCNADEKKCVKKEGKYWDRYNNGLLYLGIIDPYEPSLSPMAYAEVKGGKNNRTKRKKNKCIRKYKYTKKIYKYTKKI